MLLSNAKVSVRYAAKALSGFQTPKFQSATRQRQYAAFKRQSFSPLRDKRSLLFIVVYDSREVGSFQGSAAD